MGRPRGGSWCVQGRLLAVVCTSFEEFQGFRSKNQEGRSLVGVSLDVKKKQSAWLLMFAQLYRQESTPGEGIGGRS